jgi:cyclopropane-fatty-acyl-phospholipid synthase
VKQNISSENYNRVRAVNEAATGFVTGDGLLGWLWARGPQKVVNQLNKRIQKGSLRVHTPDGQLIEIGGHAPGPHGEVMLKNWRPVRRLVVGGHTAFATSYIEGDWDSPDMASLFEVFSLNRNVLSNTIRGAFMSRILNGIKHALRANTQDGSKKNIQFHYDLGNDFYQQWLDPSMTYSSAIFAEGDNSLESAQLRKYRRLLDMLDAKPGERILEIGSGWGGFAEIAARERGLHVTGVTLSQEQLAYAQNRIAAAGLSDQAEFHLTDYRDVDPSRHGGLFDHVVSIEMFEAVGEQYWQTYMDKVRDVLRPGGRVALQIITIDDAIFDAYRRGADFIQTYIFPGGMLPSVARLKSAVHTAGLEWTGHDGFGLQYARTLRLWLESFEQALADGKLPAAFDEKFQRIWRYYLTYCEGGFRGGGISVQQVALVKAH